MSLLNPELLEVALRPLIESVIEEKLEPRLAGIIKQHATSSENEKPIPVSEMSKVLGISISHLYKKCNSSNMPHYRKFGRIYFYLSDIRKWMAE
jgi:predicted DNA-binding transcriptional regulator AlpA